MKDLGLHSYRFSIAWPRVMPDGAGPVNQRGLDFYRRLVDGLHERGIAPMATLFHWDLPQALQDQGGWESRDVAYRFADYAAARVRAPSATDVPTWLTINEPKTVVQNGYLTGIHAPGLIDPDAAYVVAHHLLLAHGLAVQAFRASGVERPDRPGAQPAPDLPGRRQRRRRGRRPTCMTGTRTGSTSTRSSGQLPGRRAGRPRPRQPDGQGDPRRRPRASSRRPVDLLAVQYYCPIYVDAARRARAAGGPTSQAFWQQIYPEGMYDILTRVTRDYGADADLHHRERPAHAATSSAADGTVDDAGRVAFLRDHFAAAHRAIADGVPLESYHVWSLLDNFEWQQGYDERWGLVYVDYATQRRILKRSARWYRDVIARNGV